ncbi:hypothetical protein HK107_02695 [Parvularcula sp. ZS-1/3]|uniref:Uncharacterized protein n=1 Tax=Parvularcula mediterranea TaxID=2732508 RepID=A0A7Y3W4G0_9PROT|nr:hypothetical protein [Parvularcula mediterranea]NNU15232.1 hypothetical protein [Parvularcula mediterranea]
MLRRLGLSVILVAGTTGCELTPEEQAALITGISQGLQQAQYESQYGAPSGYGRYGDTGFNSRSLQVCVSRGNGRQRLVYATVRSGAELNRAAGRELYRRDRNYFSIPTAYGQAVVSVPGWARLSDGPIYGTDQQGVRWTIGAPGLCRY